MLSIQQRQKTPWPLLILTASFCGLIYLIYLAWPSLLVHSMHWQKQINDVLTNLLMESQSHSTKAILYFAGLSFVYGILHSLGPGHGKVIVTTYLSTHPTKVKTSLWLTVIAAITQALVAIILVSTLLIVFQASMREVNQASFYFMDASYLIMALLGAMILFNAIRGFLKQQRHQHVQPTFRINQIHTQETDSLNMQPQVKHPSPLIHNMAHQPHIHSDSCGCGHKHFAGADEINKANNWKQYLAIIFSIGMRPCTGAIMILLFSNIMGLYWLGVVSSILMGVGTAITISTIALLTLSGKKIIKIYQRPSQSNNQYISLIFKVIAGLLLICLGLLMAQSQHFAVAPFLR